MNDRLKQDRLKQSDGIDKIRLMFHRSARRFEIALLVGLVLIGPIMAFSYYSLHQLDGARKFQEHSLMVRDHLDDLSASIRQYEILALRSASDQDKEAARGEIERVVTALSQSVEADEIQTESLTEVRASISDFVSNPTAANSAEVRDWIVSMDSQESEYMGEHRPVAVAFLSTASSSVLLVGILSLFLSILAFVGLRRHMRAREVIETELRVAERQATLASEMKSKFLATISHEIRTPLNGIIAMSDVMRASDLPMKEKRLTDVIFQSSQALLRIINDLLNFSEIESGRVGLEVEIFSLRNLLDQTCSVLELKAEAKGLRLACSVDDRLPMTLQGDGGRLGQVLFNLVGNAIKFTASGSVDIKVERDPSSDGKTTRVNVSVSDTGQGIREEDLTTLFQPFNRLSKVGTSGEPGTGLGLSISQSLVRQMGGELRIESRVGHGSVFWFQISLLNVEAGSSNSTAVVEGPEDKSSRVAVAGARFKGLRVLVAEDNQTNQIVAGTVLEQLGCIVSFAQTGLEAVEFTAGRDFDLVLMDCQMPILDGYEATRRIRIFELSTGRLPIRIVAMTANAQADDRARCLASGMDDYVGKPFVIEDLVRAIAGGETVTDVASIEHSIEDLRVRLGATALARIRRAFLNSLNEWPVENQKFSNDVGYLKEVSHRLKSSAKTLGANGFAERLETLETLLRQQTESETLHEVSVEAEGLKAQLDRDVRSLMRLFTVDTQDEPRVR